MKERLKVPRDGSEKDMKLHARKSRWLVMKRARVRISGARRARLSLTIGPLGFRRRRRCSRATCTLGAPPNEHLCVAQAYARHLGWLCFSERSRTVSVAVAPCTEAMEDAMRGGGAERGVAVRRVHALDCKRRCAAVLFNLCLLLMFVK